MFICVFLATFFWYSMPFSKSEESFSLDECCWGRVWCCGKIAVVKPETTVSLHRKVRIGWNFANFVPPIPDLISSSNLNEHHDHRIAYR